MHVYRSLIGDNLLRYIVIAAAALLTLGLAGYMLFWNGGPTAEDVIAAIRAEQNEPDLDITLRGCQLTVELEKKTKGFNDSENYTSTYLTADLRGFQFRRVEIFPLQPKGALLKAGWDQLASKPVSLAASLIKFSELSHKRLKGGTLTLQSASGQTTEQKRFTSDEASAVDHKALYKIFAQPNGTLTFNLTSVFKSDENGGLGTPQIHEDAPLFYQFAQKAKRLEKPRALVVNLMYLGDAPKEDQLLTGAVQIPRYLQFRVASVKKAEELTELFYNYKQQNCQM
ncbi:hypothetical protein PSE_4782 [Pseudovibrio sp. FO-BEG1]|nr:hypothetical protein PSE_4782 [Pseudovibrio sp. FO-BEG1]